MGKTSDDFIQEIAKEVAGMEDQEARDFLTNLQDEIESMLDQLPEEEEGGEDEDDGAGPDSAS